MILAQSMTLVLGEQHCTNAEVGTLKEKASTTTASFRTEVAYIASPNQING